MPDLSNSIPSWMREPLPEDYFDDFEDEVEIVDPKIVFEVEDYPGTGVDCDDCGYTSDSLTFHLYDNNMFSLTVSSGCTGGFSVYRENISKVPYILEQLAEYKHLFKPGVIAVTEDKIRKLAEL